MADVVVEGWGRGVSAFVFGFVFVFVVCIWGKGSWVFMS